MADHYFKVGYPQRRVSVYQDKQKLAETDESILLKEVYKGNPIDPAYYIPRKDVDMSALRLLDKKTHCGIKGDASYYSLADGNEIAWSYEAPLEGAESIKQHLCFDGAKVKLVIEPRF